MLSPARLCCVWLCCALLFATQARAGDAASANADAKYDRTGDGLVNAEDWARMSEDDKHAYTRDSLLELGLAPDASVGKGRTRQLDYLEGLRAVYGR
ncbi:MAG: hypothetical protein AUK36_10170 [Zetaproteobacteria bacterium CG2_30_59_37]|nr:MAG: hypothetical protein AUK36_10170 [Zetaproteobacteria bacterium CG2_30_59_37]